MKKIIYYLGTLCCTILYAQEDINSSNEEIQDLLKMLIVAPQQDTCEKFESIQNPFRILHPKPSKSQKPKTQLILSAIMNQRAYINQHWYKVHEKIQGYNITTISHNYVMLQKGKRVKYLYLDTLNNTIEIH